MMPGEAYIQFILDQLNGISVSGTEDLARMLNAIHCLERLRDDIVAHKAPKERTETETAENL